VQLTKVLENAYFANVEIDIKRLVILAKAAPFTVITLARDAKPPSQNISNFRENLSFDGEHVFYNPEESVHSREIANSRQIVRLIKVVEKTSVADEKVNRKRFVI
jgi:hypothetical protein